MQASRDENRVTTLLGVSSADGTTPVTLYADPTTHRLLTQASGGAAPSDATYVVLSLNSGLSDERVLTGTANQVVITDNGAGSTVVLSLPQSIATSSTPTFASMTLTGASSLTLGTASTNAGSIILKNATNANTATIVSGVTSASYSVTWPTAQASGTQVLTNDGSGVLSWSTNGAGDVVGPGSSTDEALARFDGTTGKLLQNSTVTLGDTGLLAPATSDAAVLGSGTLMWSDLFLASGAVINFNNGDVTITHSADTLTFAGGSLVTNDISLTSGSALRTRLNAGNTMLIQARDVDGAAYTTFITLTANNTPTCDLSTAVTIGGDTIVSLTGSQTLTNKTLTAPVLNAGTVGTSLVPTSNDGAPLGDTTHQFSDLFLAEGGVINWDNGDATITQVGNVVTVAGAALANSSPGTAADSVATIDGTQTLTNKRITSRVQSVSDAATITPNADTNDCVDITAIAQAFTIANASGTPTNFQKLIIRIKDNGTARAITWGSDYVAGGVALPSTTVISKILTIGFFYNTANSLNKWQCVASAQEA